MSEGETRTPVELLRALQQASVAEGVGDNSLVGFGGRNADVMIKAHLSSEGYDMRNPEAALRAWQHRHGLDGVGFAKDGKLDLVSQMLMSREMTGKQPLEQAQIGALDDLTRLASGVGVAANGMKDGQTHGLDTVFAHAGLTRAGLTRAGLTGAAPVAATPAETAPVAAAPVVAAPVEPPAPVGDPLGDFMAEVNAKDEARLRAKTPVASKFEKAVTKPPAAPAETVDHTAKLQAAGAAIRQRASELARDAGAMGSKAADSASNLGSKAVSGLSDLGERLKGLLPDSPAASAPAVPAQPAETTKPPTKKGNAAKVIF